MSLVSSCNWGLHYNVTAWASPINITFPIISCYPLMGKQCSKHTQYMFLRKTDFWDISIAFYMNRYLIACYVIVHTRLFSLSQYNDWTCILYGVHCLFSLYLKLRHLFYNKWYKTFVFTVHFDGNNIIYCTHYRLCAPCSGTKKGSHMHHNLQYIMPLSIHQACGLIIDTKAVK